ncbi:hypothetical protein, partial [uncultured Duodenibacillus sp.]|uniref:hypothetical protein n=1 Tax=uncultured Duodenibacillus sp. TaxID=1980699 RepID=UPI0028055911
MSSSRMLSRRIRSSFVMGLRFPLLGSVPQTACSLAILSQYEIVDLPIEYCSTASEMLSSLLSRRATTLS